MVKGSKQPRGFMRYTTISFSGLDLDTFLGESGKCYATLTSVAKGLGISRQNIKDWVKNHCTTSGVPVQVGVRKSMATAYPISVLRDFLKYRVSLGDRQAAALVFSSFEADLERSIKEANGLQVTAAQHEEVRHNTRVELLKSWVAANYHPVRSHGTYGPFTLIQKPEMEEAGFTNPVEQQILEDLGWIAKTRAFMVEDADTPERVAMYEHAILRVETEIEYMQDFIEQNVPAKDVKVAAFSHSIRKVGCFE